MSFIKKPLGWCSYIGIMASVFALGSFFGVMLMVFIFNRSIYGLIFCYLIMSLALICGIYLAELARKNDGKVKLGNITIQFNNIGITKIHRDNRRSP